MIVVRNCFIAKPGQASKLAAMFKDVSAAAGIPGARVMTDLVGEFNTVVFEYEAENISEFEARMKQYTSDPVFREKMKGYTDLWESGKREILQIV
jgi:hypothetical protein